MNGKQTTAFSVGVVYVRHGATSEPATSQDIERIIEHRLRAIRASWLKGVQRVTSAPTDAIVTFTPRAVAPPAIKLGETSEAVPVRLTTDLNAPVVGLADPEEMYPYRLKELLGRLNILLRAIGIKPANPYDIRALLSVHGKDQKWTWEPKYSPKRYSEAFAEWVINQAAKDKFILQRTRSKWRRMR